MALKTAFVGLPGQNRTLLGVDAYVSGLTATGSAQGDALTLTGTFVNFTTVASGTGAILPSASNAGPVLIANNGANALLVYPASGEFINAGSANGSFSVTNAKTALFFPAGNRWFAILSA
jgi:hypothetical protein